MQVKLLLLFPYKKKQIWYPQKKEVSQQRGIVNVILAQTSYVPMFLLFVLSLLEKLQYVYKVWGGEGVRSHTIDDIRD